VDRLVNSFRIFLAVLTLLYAGLMVRDTVAELRLADGLLLADGTSPVGGDFINMFATGSLVTGGRVEEIYEPRRFMDFERTIIPADIGLRLWAYPPTSLVLAAPFGVMPYHLGLTAWSLLGLGVLAAGARRLGLSWLDTGLLVLSPAALSCVYVGQTGNVAAGLLLIALAAKRRADVGSALAATLLTVKPQLGVLLPVLWAIQRRFVLIVATVLLLAVFVGLSVALFGPQVWLDYALKTLPVLSELERNGSGAFTAMIPSAFMALRIVTGDVQLAQWGHLAVAVAAVAWASLRLVRTGDRQRQNAILLAAAALVTPYIHIYDLVIVAAAGLVHLRSAEESSAEGAVACAALLAVWALPMLTLWGNTSGVPVGPLVLIALLAVVTWPWRAQVT
jgi:alpha-1,2-mannosyltransferase